MRRRTVVFFDGDCGLCDRFVRLAATRDSGDRLRFAPLGGEAFHRLLPARDRVALPESVVVRTPGGRVLARSAAVAWTLARMDAPWPLLARVIGGIPRPLADAAYNIVARLRRRLFRPPDRCGIPPAGVRRRLLP